MIAIRQFLQFEYNHNLMEDTIDGFRYWPYVRRNIYNGAIDNSETPPTEGNDHSIRDIKSTLSIIYNLTFGNPLIKAKKRDILFISHARRSLEGSVYKCLYTDEIADVYKDTSVTCEFIYGTRHFKPAYTPNILYLDIVDILPVLFYKRDTRRYGQELEALKDKASQISTLLQNELDVTIDKDKLFFVLKKRFIWHKRKKDILKKILKKINPKVIVEVVGYEVNKMIINEAAAELGITTIELQHGPIGRGKLAYNYEGCPKYDYMPDKLLTFSQYWRDSCEFPIGRENIIPVGYPYMEAQHNKYPHQSGSKEITIIVLSQPAISEQLLQFVVSCVEQKSPEEFNYKIIYKLHPSEFNFSHQIKEQFGGHKNIAVVDSRDRSLYELFAESDIQLGVFSTAIYEGLSYNLETWIYMAEGADVEGYMGDLFRMSYAKKLFTPSEFSDLLEHYQKTNHNQSREDNPFFITGAKDKICSVIDDVLRGGDD